MPATTNRTQTIVSDALAASADEVINSVRHNTRYPFLLDAKLGDAENEPMPDTAIADAYDIPLNSIGNKMARIRTALVRTDQQHGSPLAQIAQRANDVMSRAAIINLHNRRPPLYSENTISTFIKLGCAKPNHSPIIRAAGHVAPPPVVPRNHHVDAIVADIATHLARSPEPQSVEQIRQALRDHQADLDKWPQLELTLLIRRLADIRPYDHGRYHLDENWCRFLSGQQLVADTVLRILTRDQEPRTTAYLVDETERLIRHLLPDGYNIPNAVRNSVYTSDLIEWHGPSTFRLVERDSSPRPQQRVRRRGKTGNHIHAFLMDNGPAHTEGIIQHMLETFSTKETTVRDAVYRDTGDRFLRLADRRVAANPVPPEHNPDTPTLAIVPDECRQRPAPVLRESELAWLTRYVQALDELAPPLPDRVAITGPRAAGITQDDHIAITVVVDTRHRPSLEPRLAIIAAATSGLVPSVRPNISILSPQQWDHQQTSEAPEAHHNAWLATNTTP